MLQHAINIFQTPTLYTRVSSSLYQSMTIYELNEHHQLFGD